MDHAVEQLLVELLERHPLGEVAGLEAGLLQGLADLGPEPVAEPPLGAVDGVGQQAG